MTGASAAVPAAPTAREVTAGARATYAAFAGLGLAGSTWSSRLPEVRTQLNLDSASLGLLLLTIAVGGVIVLPLSGTVVTRIGPRRAVTVVALLVIAILMALSTVIAGTTRLSPDNRTQSGSDTQARTTVM
ncbi:MULTISPECIES: hypothetical protein [unclassified Streptomyces]|uniref:hypothetical protein n=1 Tax=unclassified Streptomyces TaxID=2593676 RepID=UPI002250F3AC|nr:MULTISPECIES: hypothetical protein [unclassified Streptomyces]MCX4649371.1 hypothetical protein [Streptomyces sp. NBC_01446]MCX5321430.1 hypothetical protein [Streptomyces sp. NBC_00120]